MHRRGLLRAVGATTTVGLAACLSGESDGTKPLTGTFGPPSTAPHWHLTISGAPLEAHPRLATRDSIYVATASHVSSVSRSGERRWRVETTTHPVDLGVAPSTVYQMSGGRSSISSVIAREPGSGTARWRVPTDADPVLLGATDTAVFVGGSADDPRPVPVSAFAANSGDRRWQAETWMTGGGVVTDTRCITYYTSWNDGTAEPPTLVAFDTASGVIRWEHTVGTEIDGIHAVENSLYLVTAAGVRAYTLPAGTQKWTRSLPGRAVKKGQKLAVGGPSPTDIDTVYVGGWDGTINALAADTGETRWSRNPSATGRRPRMTGVARGARWSSLGRERRCMDSMPGLEPNSGGRC